ncbi:MAG: hypothetical protein HY033_11230 [Ignavibacteriae bacterium]|nr:hypothetical protein [Ignavibacteria bacterium]MBI3365471.1 hypothetical protein [Ignavibacteriota bacterium]
MNSRTSTIVVIVVCTVFFLTLAGCDLDSRESINLAKSTFEGISKGDQTIANNFDWTTFRLEGNDLGPSYMTLTTDYEKAQFKKALIMRMATFYKTRNWTPATVRNWKVDAKGVESAIVSAEAPGGGKIIMYMQKVSYEKKINRIEHQ